MRSDVKPDDYALLLYTQSAIAVVHANRPKPADFLEAQRRMPRIDSPQTIGAAGASLPFRGKPSEPFPNSGAVEEFIQGPRLAGSVIVQRAFRHRVKGAGADRFLKGSIDSLLAFLCEPDGQLFELLFRQGLNCALDFAHRAHEKILIEECPAVTIRLK